MSMNIRQQSRLELVIFLTHLVPQLFHRLLDVEDLLSYDLLLFLIVDRPRLARH